MTTHQKVERGSNVLLVGIILGVVLGALAGGYSPAFGREVKFVGDVFLHALFVMVVPLVVASMITGITALGDVRKLGGIGLRTVIYYTVTTGIAVAIGLVAVNVVKPGEGLQVGESHPEARSRIEGEQLLIEGAELQSLRYDPQRFQVTLAVPSPQPGEDAVLYEAALRPGAELTRTAISLAGWKIAGSSVVTEATSANGYRKFQTDDRTEKADPPRAGTGFKIAPLILDKVKSKEDASIIGAVREVISRLVPKNLIMAMAKTEVLPIMIFALFFGAILTTLGKRGEPVILFFDGANEAIMKMVQGLMYLAPIGIFALVAGRLGKAGGFEGFWPDLVQLAWYAGTVVGGLLAHGLIVLPLLLLLVGRRNPLRFGRGMATALTTAFSTASSAATLPMTLRGVEANGVDERTASFVCPLGATINMDGTAMYEAVAAMFIAQYYGYDLGIAKQIIIFLTATLAAIGAAGIPEAGLVTMVIVLNAVGLPLEGLSLILVIDWLLDRFRTTINVWGDSVGAAVIDHLEREAFHEPLREGELAS